MAGKQARAVIETRRWVGTLFAALVLCVLIEIVTRVLRP